MDFKLDLSFSSLEAALSFLLEEALSFLLEAILSFLLLATLSILLEAIVFFCLRQLCPRLSNWTDIGVWTFV